MGKQNNPEIATFHLNASATCCFARTHETRLKYGMVTAQQIHVSQRSTLHQTRPRNHSISQCVTLTLDVYEVCRCQSLCEQEGQHPLIGQRAANFRRDLEAT